MLLRRFIGGKVCFMISSNFAKPRQQVLPHLFDKSKKLIEPPRLSWRLFGLSHAVSTTGPVSCR